MSRKAIKDAANKMIGKDQNGADKVQDKNQETGTDKAKQGKDKDQDQGKGKDGGQNTEKAKEPRTVKVHIRNPVHDLETGSFWSPNIRFVNDNEEIRDNPVAMPIEIAKRAGAFLKDEEGKYRQDGSVVLAE